VPRPGRRSLTVGRLAAIVFDAEGVVVDTERIWDHGQAEFLRRRGIAYDRDLVKPLLTGRSVAEGVESLRALYGLTGDTGALARERVAIVAGLMAADAELVPGFAEFHGRVRRRYRVALATAMAGDLLDVVSRKLALDRFFGGAVVTLDDVHGRSKPEPDLFLAAADRLGVPPRACVVIEDAPHGIEAARRAGMVCVGLATTYDPVVLDAADVVARSFAEVDLDALEALADARG
jgi:beta-phosphoglucomutase